MNTVVQKLDLIESIWRHYILESKFCRSRIKFNEDGKTNYVGALLGYFGDTFEIVNSERKGASFPNAFSHSASFLQMIYVQQDFVIELLDVFKIGVTKKNLERDPDYKINRDIRNELIGHPISKAGGKLKSSTLFSYRAPVGVIEYLRYHKDNNFEFESKAEKIEDIRQRHDMFLHRYFDMVIKRLAEILNDYSSQLAKLEQEVVGLEFEAALILVDSLFERIFQSEYAYDRSSLLEIYAKKDQHLRYSCFIQRFKNELSDSLREVQSTIKTLFEPRPGFDPSPVEFPPMQIVYPGTPEAKAAELLASQLPITFHYEIGKLASNRNLREFDMYSSFLVDKCSNNRTVLDEISHMRQHLSNDVEYYTALRLIGIELKNE